MRETYDPPLRLPASEIKPGHILDLEGDPFADPDDDDEHSNSFEFEYAHVWEATRETEDCVALGGDSWFVGFPPDHLMTVVGFEAPPED